MDLSIRTIISIIFITSIIQSIVLFYQFKINKKFNGIGWWLLWSLAELSVFLIMLTRSHTPNADYLILVQNILILLSMIFLYIGIMQFIGKDVNQKLIMIISVVFFVIHFYVTIIDNIAAYRTTTNNFLIGLVTFSTAYYLYKYKLNSIKESANFTATALMFHSFVFFGVAIMNYINRENITPFNATPLNFIQYSNIFLSGILWTFGVILMLNQRLSSELTESTEDFKLLFDSSPDNILITKIDNNEIVDANKGFSDIMGFSREEVIGKSPEDLNIWKNIEDRNKFIYLIKEQGQCENLEVSFINKFGKHITGLLSGKIINYQGSPHILSVSRDITQRKEKEEIIRESEEKYRLLTENMKDVIWILDAETLMFKYISPSVEKLRGYTVDEIMAEPLDAALTPDSSNNLKAVNSAHIEKLKNGTESYDKHFINEIEQPCKDGSTVWTEVITKFHFNEKTGHIEIHGVTRDITERKKSEEEILQKNKELQKVNMEKDKFFSIISHDLRSPFNGILGLTNLLATDIKQFSNEEIQEISFNLNKGANNYFRLLTNLLEWARMQRGLTEVKPEKLHLKSIVSDSLKLYKDTAEIKNIIITDSTSDDIYVTADRLILDTIFRNLISNAIKFTYKGGSVSISAIPHGNKVEICVKDTGIGMSKELLENLFRIDMQNNRTGTNNESGTGLGLILCKEFIELSGEKLTVRSEEGKGSEFSFELKLNN